MTLTTQAYPAILQLGFYMRKSGLPLLEWLITVAQRVATRSYIRP